MEMKRLYLCHQLSLTSRLRSSHFADPNKAEAASIARHAPLQQTTFKPSFGPIMSSRLKHISSERLVLEDVPCGLLVDD